MLATVRHDRGARERPQVVFVHGTMDRAKSFERTIRRLPDVDALAVDRRGYGDSVDLGVADDITRHAADLIGVLDQRPSIVIGHSFGGLVALTAAEAEPELVIGVGAFEAPAPWLVEIGDPAGWDQRHDPALAAETFMTATIGERAWQRVNEDFRRARRAEGPAMIADFSMALDGLPFELGDVLQPVCFGAGAHGSDRYRLSAQALRADLTNSRLDTIDSSSHGVHLSQPDAFARWVASVIDIAV